MKLSSLVVAAGIVLVPLAALAQTHEGTKAEAKPVTLKGEIVDMGCYMGKGAKGMDHKSCAAKCIAGGMPMGLLTADGTLYLLTMSHASADPFNKAKELAAMNVEITGPVSEKSGMKAIEVTAITEAKPAATK